MGLDIYFHKTTVAFEGDESNPKDFRAFTDKVDELAKATLKKKITNLLKPLEDAWKHLQTNEYWRNTYNERYFTFVERIRPLVAKNYDFKIYPYTKGILDLPQLKERLDKEIEGAYDQYDAYFRKVNFIFYHFQTTLGKMYDDCYAFVDLDDVDDLIDRCERVLKDHRLAQSLLPTQDGFFFGSTDYDNWYFSDVKDCLKQMKKYRKLLKDGVTGYVIFSW